MMRSARAAVGAFPLFVVVVLVVVVVLLMVMAVLGCGCWFCLCRGVWGLGGMARFAGVVKVYDTSYS